MDQFDLVGVLESKRLNAVIGWLLVFFVAIVSGGLLGVDPIWAGFGLFLVVLVVVPPVGYRSIWVMLPWELVVLAALPLVGLGLGFDATNSLFTYMAVATVALVVAVELDAFTSVKMTDGFAVVFVIITTLAAAGLWAVARWLAVSYLGVQLVLVPRELMIEFIFSAIAGMIGGLIFSVYFRRLRSTAHLREVMAE
ncbi:hypothetical protein [Halocatena halophila]|uniref:hypothetical protein n=1 Tax=Halocatena halophila TaxID=2814576 RepID=UPI002ED23C66